MAVSWVALLLIVTHIKKSEWGPDFHCYLCIGVSRESCVGGKEDVDFI